MARQNKQKVAAAPVSESELQRRHERWLAGCGAIKAVLVVVVVAAFCWLSIHSMFYLPIQAAHGEATTINVVQTWAANVNASVWVSWGVSSAAVAYGVSERRKRNRERAEKDSRIAKLERRLDPNRTTSGLDPGGEASQGGR